MAGDWIKFEHVTPDKPEVLQIAIDLEIDQDAVVGKLIRVWVWADQQSITGKLCYDFVTLAKHINRLTGVTGFAEAMKKVGWLGVKKNQVTFPNFDRHNGKSAKSRALSSNRMKRKRYADNVTKSAPEKRREEKSIKEIKKEKILVPSVDDYVVPAPLDNPSCRDSFEHWLTYKYRDAIVTKRYKQKESAQRFLNRWQQWPTFFADRIDQAIASEYQGCIEPKLYEVKAEIEAMSDSYGRR